MPPWALLAVLLSAPAGAGLPASCTRAWFTAAAGEKIDWASLAPRRGVPVGVAPPEGDR